MARIDGHGCHIGTYKGLSLEADGDWIINVDVEGVSVTGQGDFAPVVHARWEPYQTPIETRQSGWICTNCSGVQKDLSNGDTEYCPHCGAKMDGGDQDG